MPPLTVSADEIDHCLTALHAALDATS